MHRMPIACAAITLILSACVHEGSASRTSSAPAAPPGAAPAPTVTEATTATPGRAAAPAPPAAVIASVPVAANAPQPGTPISAAAAPRTTSTTSAARTRSTSAKAPAAVAAGPPGAPASAPPAAPASPAAGAAPATAPTLDLNGLEQRLRDTRAIGVFTKLTLKNQVDDLLARFKAYHQGQAQVSLPQLRQQYEVLLLKVISLLQDDDPSLASAVSSSRDAIWGVLTDPKKFANI